jgi:polygalacturonase
MRRAALLAAFSAVAAGAGASSVRGGPAAVAGGATCDAVRDCGAVADNATDAAPALTACVARGGACGAPGSTVVFAAGASFRVGSIDASHTVGLTLSFGAGAGLFGAADHALYPLQTPLPPTNEPQLPFQWRALFYARNASGLTLEGPRSAVVDGLGWPWWAAFNNGSLPYQRPKLVEIVDSRDVTLRGMTFRNSPFWTLHALYSSNLSFVDLAVLAPRAVGNTDGIDPDSCTDVLIDSCFIDVGDDGISIKSDVRVDPVTGVVTLEPSARILVRNTTVLSRNIAIGSSTYGNVTDVVFEGGRVGDDEGSSPWAFKVKTHTPFGGVVRNITVRGTRIGAIKPNTWQQRGGGTAIYVDLRPYNTPILPPGSPQPAASAFEDITLEDVHATSAVACGDLSAAAPFFIERLTMRNVTIGGAPRAWACARLAGTVASGVVPPLPAACGV